MRRRRNQQISFHQLPVDIIHLIFGMVLNLDRIHDYDLPLDDLVQYRVHLFNMRRVSLAWNAVLLSSPRYWCAIDIGTPDRVAASILARAQQTPLCLYFKYGGNFPSTSLLDRGNSVLPGYMAQVKSIRSDDEDVYQEAIRALRGALPNLQTLELTKATNWRLMVGEFLPEDIKADLPAIRHLTTVGWQPSADATWLQNLQILTLKPPLSLNVNLLRILRACRSLSRLTLRADDGPDSAAEMVDAPSLIDLPCLQEIDIELDIALDLGYIVPILRLPSQSRRFLRITRAGPDEASLTDICRFLDPHATGLPPLHEATLKIGQNYGRKSRAVYTAGKGGLDLFVPRKGGEDQFHDLIQAIQEHNKNPPLSVTLGDTDINGPSALQRLADLNITRIWAEWGVDEAVEIEGVLDVLGSNYPDLPLNAEEHEKWPFESLRELNIEGTTLDLGYLTRMITIRQQYLRKFSKTWLQKVTLIDCLPGSDMSLEAAATELSAMGVTLVVFDNNVGQPAVRRWPGNI